MSQSAELRKEAWGPEGDAAHHRSLDELEAGERALPDAPKRAGRVALIVRRRADGVRETPESTTLTPEDGLPGDGWGRRPPRDPEAQLAVMRFGLAEFIANGQPLTLFGDNLFVDLDISAANMPVGLRIRLGDAVVEVSPKPHTGCHKFKQRFGADALQFLNAQPAQNRRGIYWRVVEAGEASVGAAIEVVD